MSSWREQLQPASFRGVPFFVDSDSTPVGRRTQVHEYPQRDKPLVEDMGRKTRETKLTGFVIGEDCLFQRDNLLNALDQAGAGELIHPWFGRMMVTATEGCQVSHERREGGLVRFELVFTEDGEKGYPVGVPNTGQQVEESSESLLDSAIARYKSAMAVVNRARLAVAVLQNSIAGIQMAIQQEFAQLIGIVTSVEALADMLINAPGNFAAMFRAQFASISGHSRSSGYRWGPSKENNSSPLAPDPADAATADPVFARTVAGLPGNEPEFSNYIESAREVTSMIEVAQALIESVAAARDGSSAAGGAATVEVVRAASELVRDALIVLAARSVAAMPAVLAPAPLPGVPSLSQQMAAPVERPPVPAVSDIVALRDALDALIWTAALTSTPDHFELLEGLRKRVKTHLTDVARSGVRLVEVAPKESLPVLLLAYQCFGDASRSEEIVSRNKVSHPGFLPPGPLKVAQE